MRYYKKLENDYLYAIGTGPGGEEITREEYENIVSIIRNRPTADAGYQYRLKADLTWELTEAPALEDAEATQEDYIAALAELGVSVNEEI